MVGHAGLPLFHAIISFCVLIKRDHMSDCNVYNLSTLHFYNLLTTLFLNSSSLLIYKVECMYVCLFVSLLPINWAAYGLPT